MRRDWTRLGLGRRGRGVTALAVGVAHLLVVWALMPLAKTSLVAPDSFSPTIDVWLGPNPGGSTSRASPTSQQAVTQSQANSAKLPIDTRKPPPQPHPDPIPPKTEQDRAAPSPVAKPAPATLPPMVAGPANWSGRGPGQGFGRGMGRDLGGGGTGGAGESTGKAPRKYVWARELTTAERQSVYPAAGRYTDHGSVLLSCLLRGEDRVGGCLILSEQPAGHGFGAAAIRASQLRGVRPEDPANQPGPGERIEVVMRFVRLEAGG